MFGTIAIVSVGGALGAVARYGVNVATVHLIGTGFPWSTLIVNILGSFLMGLMIAKFSQMNAVSHELRMFCMTGFLGAFTTFSTFSLDFVTMWERGEMLQAMIYMLASVVFSVLALFLALWIMRGITP
ncbi:MAG: fluoride efflux transporter CrcB [Alphaproteobacteria bacterium]